MRRNNPSNPDADALRQQTEQLATLAKVAALLTQSLSPSDVLDTIVSSAGLVAQADAAAVFLAETPGGPLRLAREVGFHHAPALVPLLMASVGVVPAALMIADVAADDRAAPVRALLLAETKHAALEVPMVRAGQCEGVIAVYFDQAAAVSPQQMDVMHLFAAQAANALHNARLYQTTDRALGITAGNLKTVLDARESYIQMIVHDLRSPLTAVTTSLRLLTELMPPNTPEYPLIVRTTDISRRALRKVLMRIDSILDVARMESDALSLVRQPAALLPLVENVKAELAPLAEEMKVQIIVDVPASLPPLNVDTDKVERLILNLIDNALKYAPHESVVVVDAQVVESGFIRLNVRDQGQGVPDSYKRKLFDRFVQVEERPVIRRGMGLGLSFCRAVAEAHGGAIWVEDNPGGGAVFSVRLPGNAT
jgi:signal transduction histidine kinase